MNFSSVLVTGGAGFIGSHLVARLLKEGFEVVVLDNLSTGGLENLELCLENENLRFVKGSIIDEQAMREALKDVEAVFHLAAITSVPYSVEYPGIIREVNVDGTRKLLEECLSAGVERFIYVSSCAVYGEPEYLPIDEKHPARPVSPYAESKLEAERLCREFQKAYGLKTTIVRPFNVYGPRMKGGRYGGVIARFIERLRSNKPPIIYGDGTQTRDFVHVWDIINALMHTLNNQKAIGEIFNVASGVATSIGQLAKLVMELSGVDGLKPLYRPARNGDIKHSYADISKAKARLGYEPKISLREGVATLFRHAEVFQEINVEP